MKNRRVIVAGAVFLVAVTARAADDWSSVTPSPAPSPRYNAAMASLGSGQVLLFGGFNTPSGFLDDTWISDGSSWTLQSPHTSPAKRDLAAVAPIGAGNVLLFGGEDGSGTALGDTWTWVFDTATSEWTWKEESPSVSPLPRYGARMAYLGGSKVLLFGGFGGVSGYSGETWVYDLTTHTWTLEAVAGPSPSARTLHAMAPLGGGKVLLFGGRSLLKVYGDTWVFDSTSTPPSWNQQALISPAAPSARHSMAMASLGGGEVLLFGGNVGTGSSDESWVYDAGSSTWTQDPNSTQPSARERHGMAETDESGIRRVVLFGGYSGSLLGDTWQFGGGDYPLPVSLTRLTVE